MEEVKFHDAFNRVWNTKLAVSAPDLSRETRRSLVAMNKYLTVEYTSYEETDSATQLFRYANEITQSILKNNENMSSEYFMDFFGLNGLINFGMGDVAYIDREDLRKWAKKDDVIIKTKETLLGEVEHYFENKSVGPVTFDLNLINKNGFQLTCNIVSMLLGGVDVIYIQEWKDTFHDEIIVGNDLGYTSRNASIFLTQKKNKAFIEGCCRTTINRIVSSTRHSYERLFRWAKSVRIWREDLGDIMANYVASATFYYFCRRYGCHGWDEFDRIVKDEKDPNVLFIINILKFIQDAEEQQEIDNDPERRDFNKVYETICAASKDNVDAWSVSRTDARGLVEAACVTSNIISKLSLRDCYYRTYICDPSISRRTYFNIIFFREMMIQFDMNRNLFKYSTEISFQILYMMKCSDSGGFNDFYKWMYDTPTWVLRCETNIFEGLDVVLNNYDLKFRKPEITAVERSEILAEKKKECMDYCRIQIGLDFKTLFDNETLGRPRDRQVYMYHGTPVFDDEELFYHY